MLSMGSCAAKYGHNAPATEVVCSMEYMQRSSWLPHPVFAFYLEHDKEKGRYLLTNASDCERENGRTIEVPDSFVQKLVQIVKEEKMYEYERDYQSPYMVLDGDSWTLYIGFENREMTVYSSGYMAYPEGDGLKRVEQLCRETWAELGPKDQEDIH
jgi:hypothetical protein